MAAHRPVVVNKLLVSLGFMLSLLLSGCASLPGRPNTDINQLFIDSAFVKPVDLPDPNQVFYLSPHQKRQFAKSIISSGSKSLTSQLIANVLHNDYSAFDYDNSYTRTASETYEHKQGNCLSMVIMTATMAKYLGIEYVVQEIQSAPVWSRDGGLLLLNGHVNIRLDTTTGTGRDIHYSVGSKYVTLDFIPSRATRKLSKTVVSEQRLIAMYFVNLAADAMVMQQWDRAYFLLKASIGADRYYSPAWNSLAVLYRHNHQHQFSEDVYRYAMKLNPDDMNLVANFSVLLESQGRYAELFEYQRLYDLAQIQNPYHYYDQAEIAYQQHQYKLAIRLYKKALLYSDFVGDFYFGLFKSYYALGNVSRAKKYLQLAQRLSQTQRERLRYNAKLALLAKS